MAESHAPHAGSFRLLELDALRGIAALAVLLYHYADRFDQAYHHRGYFPYTFEIGKYGVQLFFVVSGFVIFWSLQRTRQAGDFIVSRFSRLFPAYWCALAITFLLVSTFGLPGQQVTWHDLALNLPMFPDFLRATPVDGSYWTLQIELFFYVQMLFWFMIGALPHIRWIVVGWLCLAAAYAIADRAGLSLSYSIRELLDLRYIAYFATGILLFDLRGRAMTAFDAVLLGAAVAVSGLTWSWREALVLIACMAAFLLLNAGRLGILRHPALLFLGAISYTLYLTHQEIGYILIAALERAGVGAVTSILLATAMAVALAWLLHRAVERPAMLALRSRYARWREARHPPVPEGLR